jgi:carbon-monoxide dehydrogenase large subunit
MPTVVPARPEACYELERMVDAAAAALKMDPAELRKKNFIPKFSGAFQTQVAGVVRQR